VIWKLFFSKSVKFGPFFSLKILCVGWNPILLYFWLPIGTYHKSLAIWNFFPSKSKQIWVIFFIKILCIGQNYILQVMFMSIGSCLSSWGMSHLFLIKHTYVVKVIHQTRKINTYHNVDACKGPRMTST
jgi:hypothetical protein